MLFAFFYFAGALAVLNNNDKVDRPPASVGQLYFFCSKYSDLDNMLPIIFLLLEDDSQKKVTLFWYGNLITSDCDCLLSFGQETFGDRLTVWAPSGNRLVPYSKKAHSLRKKKGLFGKLQRLRQIINMRFWGGDCHPQLSRWIISKIEQNPLDSDIREMAFFGFSEREVLNQVAKAIQPRNPIWIRLPQGVRLTVSAFRTLAEVAVPNHSAVTSYIPHWTHCGIEVEDFMYKHYVRIHQTLGHELEFEMPKFLGSPRFSSQWIDQLDRAFKFKGTSFDASPVNGKRILFLLTPWHKNVWFDETMRALKIISSYDVFLVVKGFHSNTTRGMKNEGFVIDEETPTSMLIRDADAVIYIATSSALEGYVRGKEMLQLSYLHGNQTSLEQSGNGLMARSRDDVHLFMNHFAKNGTFTSPSDTDLNDKARSFILDRIVGDNPKGEYLDLLNQIAG